MRTVQRPHRQPNYNLDVVPTAQLTRPEGGPPSQPPAHQTLPPVQPVAPDYTNLIGHGVMNTEEWQALRDLQRWTAVYEQILRASPMPFRSHEHEMAGMTNELRMDCVVGLRKMARKMEMLALRKKQLYDIHLEHDPSPWGGA